MAEDLGEKTEQATPKRKQDARDEGNVAKSQDLAGALLLLGGAIGLWFFTNPMLGSAKTSFEELLQFGGTGDPYRADDIWALLTHVGAISIRIAAPLLILVWVVALLASIVQVGILFSPAGIQPKLSKINPIEGFKRLFSMRSVMKAVIDSAKVAVVIIIALITIAQYRNEILVLPQLALKPAMVEIGWMLLDLMLRVVAVLLVLGIIDFIWQQYKHQSDMKMTKQQVKDELKQTEGDPDVKRRRMRMAQMLSQQRINAAVPRADVVVTNPEHYSVAIQYDAEKMKAPKVVAKGADFLALRIRQIARQHNIPVIERKPLARALYKEVKVGQEVPEEFYVAVAEILAYVYKLKKAA